MSTLNIFSGYFQISLTEEAIPKTAFISQEGQWEYLYIPFRLCNTSVTFQQMMNKIFKDMIGKNLAVYLDDVTIFSETFEQHLEILEKVFNRLRENGLFIKPSKCELVTDRIKLLGFVLDGDGLRTDPEKVSAIAKF